MEHQLWVTHWVNAALGRPVAAVLGGLGLPVSQPNAPIPDHIAMELVVLVLAAGLFAVVRLRLSVERPGALQQFLEALLTNPLGLGVRDLVENFIGHGGEMYLPMLGSVGLFVLMCNLISLVPTLESPTAEKTVPLGCALVAFLYYHWCGLRRRGPVQYGAHFLGPLTVMGKAVGQLEGWVRWLATPIVGLVSVAMPVVELFSHLARVVSLTARLWANMLASETLYSLFLGLTLGIYMFAERLGPAGQIAAAVPLLGPLVFIGLHVFVAFVQAFVFTILPTIYVAGAVAEAH
jgi:F-type H+-transporting ATPase subunit a